MNIGYRYVNITWIVNIYNLFYKKIHTYYAIHQLGKLPSFHLPSDQHNHQS